VAHPQVECLSFCRTQCIASGGSGALCNDLCRFTCNRIMGATDFQECLSLCEAEAGPASFIACPDLCWWWG